MSSHYSQAFKPSFISQCYNAAELIVNDFRHYGKGYPVLCYSGFSGITAATMIYVYIKDMGMRVEQIYVRKPGEKSHGGEIEFSNRNIGSQAVPVFVDDFIDRGETHERVRQALIAHHNKTERHLPHYEPWSGFFFLSDLEEIKPIFDDNYLENVMPFVLINGIVECDLRPELWENDVPDLTNNAA
jgi:hypothetical protein